MKIRRWPVEGEGGGEREQALVPGSGSLIANYRTTAGLKKKREHKFRE